MTALAALQTDDAIALDTNVVSGGYERVDSSKIYEGTITYAYLHTAKSGALALALHFKTDGGANYRETVYMTSGTAKGGHNYYVGKDGKKNYLPGFVVANSVALLAAGKGIGEISTEEKVIKLYDYQAKAEVPTTVQMFTDLVNKPVKLGIRKQVRAMTSQADDGAYVPNGDFRIEYVINKVFRASDDMTVAEITAQSPEANYINTWSEQNTDVVFDGRSAKEKDLVPFETAKELALRPREQKQMASAPQAAAAPMQPTPTPAPTNSLFA